MSAGTLVLECRNPSAPLVGSEMVAATSRVGTSPARATYPSVIFKVDPEYSEQARKVKLQGSVLLSVVVDGEGRARSMRIVRKRGLGLDQEAIVAVGQWRFRPAMKDGQPADQQVSIEVNFRLL